MPKKNIKEWTILNYANGNNEYEPEMNRILTDIREVKSSLDINMVIQIGREKRELARIIRPYQPLPEDEDMWTGVRRYSVDGGELRLLQDMGSINMADPKALYDFIIWGMKNYPAKKYMLILGGHGASFVGTLTDYSQDRPYIMGTAEMCRAINMVQRDTDLSIDILVLDICYMNLLEIMYELGKEKINTVKYVLTYIEDGPMSGLPYKHVFSLVYENRRDGGREVLEKLVKGINLNLVGIEIDNKKLKKLKKLSNDLAYKYFSERGEIRLTPFELLTDLKAEYPWYENALELQRDLSEIVLFNRQDLKKGGNLINIMLLDLKDLVKVYKKLSFAKGNYWTELLYDKDSIDDTKPKENFAPTEIMPDGMKALIKVMNPSMKEEGIMKILNRVYEHQGWELKSNK